MSFGLRWVFVTGPDGKDEARGGEHDNDVMCAAMCWYAIPVATEYRRAVRRCKLPRDFKSWKTVGAVARGW